MANESRKESGAKKITFFIPSTKAYPDETRRATRAHILSLVFVALLSRRPPPTPLPLLPTYWPYCKNKIIVLRLLLLVCRPKNHLEVAITWNERNRGRRHQLINRLVTNYRCLFLLSSLKGSKKEKIKWMNEWVVSFHPRTHGSTNFESKSPATFRPSIHWNRRRLDLLKLPTLNSVASSTFTWNLKPMIKKDVGGGKRLNLRVADFQM